MNARLAQAPCLNPVAPLGPTDPHPAAAWLHPPDPETISPATQRQSSVVWIEQLSWRGGVKLRQRFTELPVLIGRGYGNHLMIEDRHMADQHARLASNPEGGISLLSQGDSRFWLGDAGKAVDQAPVFDGQEVRLGKTWLRFRLPGTNEAAAAAEPQHSVVSGGHRQARLAESSHSVSVAGASLASWAWVVALWLTAHAFMLLTHSQWGLENQDTLKHSLLLEWQRLPKALAWVAGWAILSRLVGGQWMWHRHAATAAIGVAAYQLSPMVWTTLSYNLQWGLAAKLETSVAWMWVLGMTTAAHLVWLLRQLPRGTQVSAYLSKLPPLAVLGTVGYVGFNLYPLVERHARLPSVLMAAPAPLSFRKAATVEEFMGLTEATRFDIEAAVRRPPSPPLGSD